MYGKNIIDGFRTILSATSIADVHDQALGKAMFLSLEIKNRVNDRKIVGSAVTTYEDITDEELPPWHALDVIGEPTSGSTIIITGNPPLETVVV